MGHRFEIYTTADKADRIIDIAAGFNLDARIVGHCEAFEKKKLTIKSEYGVFEY